MFSYLSFFYLISKIKDLHHQNESGGLSIFFGSANRLDSGNNSPTTQKLCLQKSGIIVKIHKGDYRK